MSLFGTQNQSGGLFNTANKPSPFGGGTTGGSLFSNANTNTTNDNATTNTGGGLFSNPTQQSGGLFGNTAAQTQPQSGGMLGNTATQQKPAGGGLFGGLGQSTQQQQPQQPASGGLFGGTLGQQQKPQGSMFGGIGQQQQQAAPQQGGGMGGLFSGLGQTQQQPQPQQSLFGGSLLGGQQQAQQGQQPAPQLGQSTQQPGSSLWSPGRAVTGVHRTVPTQILIVRDKWDSASRSSPFRTYLYNNVGEEAAPFYQPGPDDDETKWEEALRKRPAPGYVPVIVRGFFELGKRAQRQKDFLTMMQTRLHEINNCLTELLSRHDLKISVRIADCRRKHIVLSKRCLALAAKTQVLRNRGYAMDDAEEELKKKLAQLERSVFDPSLNGREEEIWARMLAIREHSKRLQLEMEKAGPGAAAQADDDLDEQTMKTARKILDDYHTQIQHLQKELESVKRDFDEAQELQNGGEH
ncbi:nucleoporin complex subunit 54-domain-containing protein [Aspergillus avenaceus]|uniref:Nucleoporin complex subunit 54-domain-containing protein n=1 Tax=Aspergillus avenaceus TaxID=36643 RepID=A0A5N6U729_ASPAV|nr:nucleoporin complex subunit 54-domain-containing protein [Aspergillus avenaceus]